MERESFEDASIARLMNEHFVNIKAETVRQILDGLGNLSTFKEVAKPLDRELLDRIGRALTRHVDPVYGGFGRAPKFPNTMNHAFLLRHFRAQQDEFALRMVTLTLEKMAGAGIFDHLGGGFHRYSVDNRWLVPHFEKMLYDKVVLVAGAQELGELPAVRGLLTGKGQVDGRATAYVCHGFTCSAPVTDPAALQALLRNVEFRTKNVER